jgi:hypothetical protein
MPTMFWLENLKGRDNYEYLDTGGITASTWFLVRATHGSHGCECRECCLFGICCLDLLS